jgi:uncharacterized protein (TIGR02246 family)
MLEHGSMCSFAFRLVMAPLFAVLLQAQSAGPADEAAIRQVVHKYLDAREHRDAKAVAEVFTADADQLVSTGEWRKGREALVRGTLASSESTGGRRTITIQTVRLLAPSVALADGPYELTGLVGGTSRSMWTTFVLTRESDGWRIAAIRNMRPATPVPAK